MATKPMTSETGLFVVRVSFMGPDGIPYRVGEVVHPDDPAVQAMPERFRPFEFPHPVKRGRSLATPDIRAE